MEPWSKVIQWHNERLKWRRQINVEEAKLTKSWHPLDRPFEPSASTGRRYLSLWKPLPNASVVEAEEIREKLKLLDLQLQKATELAEEQALFHLAAGEALIVDNWRLLHSRQPYQGRRKMWRLWSWTSAGSGAPADGARTSQPLESQVFAEL
ncbi:unnamed protein product [Durusdinium trenchii]|uniref:Uncharacterized protein n=2 Tax=Durusdinium trenchii TaxID=1381693 RepID=A0ABP0NXR2_9DINO